MVNDKLLNRMFLQILSLRIDIEKLELFCHPVICRFSKIFLFTCLRTLRYNKTDVMTDDGVTSLGQGYKFPHMYTPITVKYSSKQGCV